MRLARTQRLWLQRTVAVLTVIVAIPLLIAGGTFADEAPIREGQPSPRTVVADQQVRITDEAATQQARERAELEVEAVEIYDAEAQAEIISAVREVFAAVREVRQPVTPTTSGEGEAAPSPAPQPREPSEQEQLNALRERVPFLDDEALNALIDLSDSQLQQVSSETVAVAQQLARQRIGNDELEQVLDEQLPVELALRSFPGEIESRVVEPLIREVLRPTVTVDVEQTRAERQRAYDAVAPIVESWREGEPIVREGEEVTPLQFAALEQAGLTGTEPRIALLRSFVALSLILLVVAVYLRQMQPRVWRSGRKVLLLSFCVAAYAVVVVGIGFLADVLSAGWWFAVPAGALAMLVAILVAPVVGIATMLPAVVLVLLVAPQYTALAVFVASAVLVSVPMVTRIGSRGDLRSASLRAGLSFPVMAMIASLVFGPRDQVAVAAVAGAANAVLTALLVQGLLPFLETLFRLPTVTALLDLADRNHPLLRELEQKAIGSYNHSVMVASLVERACREIGANELLGSVAALYHDIGKVRQPHFFIENQQGIHNPHDDLEPEISAVIIQNHVVDGVEMAREYRLPPEVVAAIGSHHGTMLVTFFYRKALDRVGGDPSQLDVDHYRYKGSKPHSKEAATLLMADCCEATTRSMAMDRGTLSREEIETTVARLIQERVDDGQFEECDLTFAEMSTVQASIVEALVGIYHPRIAYPGRDEESDPESEREGEPVTSS